MLKIKLAIVLVVKYPTIIINDTKQIFSVCFPILAALLKFFILCLFLKLSLSKSNTYLLIKKTYLHLFLFKQKKEKLICFP